MRTIKFLIPILLLVGINSFVYADDACEKLIPTSLREALRKKFPDYRIAKATDQLYDDPKWNTDYKEGQCLTVASADFDGDNKKDFALFLVHKNTKTPKLIAALSREKQWSLAELPIWNEHIQGCYVETAKPGTYEHTMSYDYKQLHANQRERLTAINTSIVAGLVESTGVVYVYEKGQWLYVWASD